MRLFLLVFKYQNGFLMELLQLKTCNRFNQNSVFTLAQSWFVCLDLALGTVPAIFCQRLFFCKFNPWSRYMIISNLHFKKSKRLILIPREKKKAQWCCSIFCSQKNQQKLTVLRNYNLGQTNHLNPCLLFSTLLKCVRHKHVWFMTRVKNICTLGHKQILIWTMGSLGRDIEKKWHFFANNSMFSTP